MELSLERSLIGPKGSPTARQVAKIAADFAFIKELFAQYEADNGPDDYTAPTVRMVRSLLRVIGRPQRVDYIGPAWSQRHLRTGTCFRCNAQNGTYRAAVWDGSSPPDSSKAEFTNMYCEANLRALATYLRTGQGGDKQLEDGGSICDRVGAYIGAEYQYLKSVSGEDIVDGVPDNLVAHFARWSVPVNCQVDEKGVLFFVAFDPHLALPRNEELAVVFSSPRVSIIKMTSRIARVYKEPLVPTIPGGPAIELLDAEWLLAGRATRMAPTETTRILQMTAELLRSSYGVSVEVRTQA